MTVSNINELIARLEWYVDTLSHDRALSTKEYVSDTIRALTDTTISAIDETHGDITDISPSLTPRDILTPEPGSIISFSGVFSPQKPEEIKKKLEYKRKKESTLPFLFLPSILFTLPLLPIYIDGDIRRNPRTVPNQLKPNQENQQQRELWTRESMEVDIPWGQILAASVGTSIGLQQLVKQPGVKAPPPQVRPVTAIPSPSPSPNQAKPGAPRTTTHGSPPKTPPKTTGGPVTTIKGSYNGPAVLKSTPQTTGSHGSTAKGGVRGLVITTALTVLTESILHGEESKVPWASKIFSPEYIKEYNRYLAEDHDWENDRDLRWGLIEKEAMDNRGWESMTDPDRFELIKSITKKSTEAYMEKYDKRISDERVIEMEKSEFERLSRKKETPTDWAARGKMFIDIATNGLSMLGEGSVVRTMIFSDIETRHPDVAKLMQDEMGVTPEFFDSLEYDQQELLFKDAISRVDTPDFRSPLQQEWFDSINEEGGTGNWRSREQSIEKTREADLEQKKAVPPSLKTPKGSEFYKKQQRMSEDDRFSAIDSQFSSDIYASLDIINTGLENTDNHHHNSHSINKTVILTDDYQAIESQITDTA